MSGAGTTVGAMSEWWGRAPGVGDLVQRRGKWMTLPPTRCPRGHELEPSQVLVGHVACLGHGGGHTVWHCRQCPDDEQPTYGPALGKHCSVLAGPVEYRTSFRGSSALEAPGRPVGGHAVDVARSVDTHECRTATVGFLAYRPWRGEGDRGRADHWRAGLWWCADQSTGGCHADQGYARLDRPRDRHSEKAEARHR